MSRVAAIDHERLADSERGEVGTEEIRPCPLFLRAVRADVNINLAVVALAGCAVLLCRALLRWIVELVDGCWS